MDLTNWEKFSYGVALNSSTTSGMHPKLLAFTSKTAEQQIYETELFHFHWRMKHPNTSNFWQHIWIFRHQTMYCSFWHSWLTACTCEYRLKQWHTHLAAHSSSSPTFFRHRGRWEQGISRAEDVVLCQPKVPNLHLSCVTLQKNIPWLQHTHTHTNDTWTYVHLCTSLKVIWGYYGDICKCYQA